MENAPEGHKPEKLSAIFESFQHMDDGKPTVGSMLQKLDAQGMAAVLILFAIPSALPIPAAGYSTLMAIPLLLIGSRLLCGYHTVWLWDSALDRRLDMTSHPKTMERVLKLMRFTERFTRPRLIGFAASGVTFRLLGLLICVLACSMALPIPGTNTLPAGGIFLIGFGLLEEDGIVLLFGLVYSVVALCVSIAMIYGVLYLGVTGVRELISLISG